MSTQLSLLTSEVCARASRSVLCWLATVDDHGQPNVSPKEIWKIADDNHVVIANIASPVSVRNVTLNEKVCLSFVDILVQKGFKLYGVAQVIPADDPTFFNWAQSLLDMVGDRFTLHSVIVVKVSSVQPILAPSYWMYPQETTEQSQVAAARKNYGLN